ncbi:glutaredoxin family protein [Anoxybacillus flavithermus]|uniref:Glutaredoxin family protein n=3 Tax=Bacillales TaxID=1385 RepID=A0AAX2A0B5_9BACL|nr:glutaredoxin family protein [Anoxybacillus flavithermus]
MREVIKMSYSITVYTNPFCGHCYALKAWLKEMEINFIERDIVNDVSAAQEFRELGQKYTPFTVIETVGERHEILGANIKKIARILSLDKDVIV